MAVRISTQQLIARRIVKNGINRLNSNSEYASSPEYQEQLTKMSEYGITPFDSTNVANLDRIIDNIKQNYDLDTALKEIDKTPNKNELKRRIQKRKGFKPTTTKRYLTKEEFETIKQQDRESYDMKNWIDSNLSFIYEYEREYGRVISGRLPNTSISLSKRGKPTKEALENMRAEIEKNKGKYTPKELSNTINPFDSLPFK